MNSFIITSPDQAFFVFCIALLFACIGGLIWEMWR